MSQSTQRVSSLTLVSSPSLKLIEADLAQRGLNTNTRQLFLFLWRAKTQPKKLPMGLIFSEKTMATELHVDVRTIQRAIKTLVGEGLLTVQTRTRPDGGVTTNRYIPTWRPAAATKPTASRAPLTVPLPSESEKSEEQTLKITPDTVFVWPALSGGTPSICQGGQEPQNEEGQALEGTFEEPIANNQTFSKSDQLIPGGPLLRFDSENHLQLFLFASLKTQGITPHKLSRWIRQYGLPRIVQLTTWLLSAPKGAIRAPGGWMTAALTEGWEAPLWVRAAREKSMMKAQTAIREQVAETQTRAEGEKVAAYATEAEALWADIAPRLTQLPALYAYAHELARKQLKSSYAALFKPGSSLERSFIVRAAQECPDLLIANDGESA